MINDEFIGTWKLVSLESRTVDGRVSYPLGRDVTGTIVVSSFLVIVWHGVWTFIQYG